jgi:hypothetical protein
VTCHRFVVVIKTTTGGRLPDLAAGEGVEPSSSGSKPDVLPVAPSRKALPIARRNVENQLAINNRQSAMTLVAVEGIEPTSLDYQSSALAIELHRGKKSFVLWALYLILYLGGLKEP